MIKAEHNKYAKFIFDIYLKRLLKSSFEDFILINQFPKVDKDKGLVVVANHFSWWDGFFVYWLLNKKLNRKIFIMMLEEQLKRYWFFRKIGCYSINLENKSSTITSLRYTLETIKNKSNVLVIFPQGEIQPYEKRPIELKDGINFLSKTTNEDFLILPIALKIHYANEKHPFVFCRCGELISSKDTNADSNFFAKKFVENLDSLNTEFSSSIKQSLL